MSVAAKHAGSARRSAVSRRDISSRRASGSSARRPCPACRRPRSPRPRPGDRRRAVDRADIARRRWALDDDHPRVPDDPRRPLETSRRGSARPRQNKDGAKRWVRQCFPQPSLLALTPDGLTLGSCYKKRKCNGGGVGRFSPRSLVATGDRRNNDKSTFNYIAISVTSVRRKQA